MKSSIFPIILLFTVYGHQLVALNDLLHSPVRLNCKILGLTRRSTTKLVMISTDSNPGQSSGIKPSALDILSATSLISGTTVGAGILALPSSSYIPGFLPSTCILVGTWIFMCITGLLIAEVSCNIAISDPSSRAPGLLSMINTTLGNKTRNIGGFIYLFIHYALLVAYVSEAGGIISEVFNLDHAVGPILFSGALAAVMIMGSIGFVELFNNIFVFIVFSSFFGLLLIGLPSVNNENLLSQDWSGLNHSIPVMIVALVFHNIVPSICTQLSYHKDSITKAISIGSFLPLCMFILWNFVILGIGGSQQDSSVEGFDAVAVLRGSSSQGAIIGPLISIFSEAAIITSFIGFVIGLMDFFADLFPSKSNRDLGLYGLVLVPPTTMAIAYPSIFNTALEYCGIYGSSVLFGAIPALMALKTRYGDERRLDENTYGVFVPGGKPILVGVLLMACYVVGQKLLFE